MYLQSHYKKPTLFSLSFIKKNIECMTLYFFIFTTKGSKTLLLLLLNVETKFRK